MQSSVSVIRHQWLLYAVLLLLALLLCLPQTGWPLIMLPLCFIVGQCLQAKPLTHFGTGGLFAVWLICFAKSMWV